MTCLTRFLPARLLSRYCALAFVLTAVFFCGLFLASPAAAFTVIDYQVTGEENWTKEGSPYIICEGAGVAADATLTIEDGVEVQLGYGTVWIGETKYSVWPTFRVAGDLNATGTTFTPFTGPVPWGGYNDVWSAIRFVDGSSGTFTTCTFVYGGEGAVIYSMIMVDDHTANVELTFNDCTFREGVKGGIYFRAGSGSSLTVEDSIFTELSQSIGVHRDTAPDAIITIRNCTISNVATGSKNWAAMAVQGGTATITGCTFNSNGGNFKESKYNDVVMYTSYGGTGPYKLTFTNNHLDGGGIARYPLIIASQTRINEGIKNAGNTFANYADGYRYLPIMGGIPAGAAAYWGEIGLEYLVEREGDEHSLAIRANDSAIGSLTIAPGRTVYFKGSAAGITMWGSITARGTPEEPITFATYPGEQPSGKFEIPFPLWEGYGMYPQRSAVFFEHCVFDELQKGIEVSYSNAEYVDVNEISLTVRNCTFRNIPGCAVHIKGDVYSIDHGNVLIEGCTVTNCGESLGDTGSVLCFKGFDDARRCSPKILNTVVANNSKTGVFLSYSNAVLENCTISANGTAGVHLSSANSAVIKNSILWGNTLQDLQASADQTQVSYSCIGTHPPDFDLGETNISEDPLFADPANGDFHLKSEAGRWDPSANGGAGGWVTDDVTSPCVDAGDPESDYANEPAPNGGRINMGACGNTIYASKSISEQVQALTIGTAFLPEGMVGESYSAALEATGGTAPYTWSITSGSLPNGLELDSVSGEIYGTPTVGGQFDFTVTVTDAVYDTDSRSLSISIMEQDLNPPTVPQNLRVTGRTSTSITIAWDASTDDESGIAEYIVEMKQGSGEFEEAGTTTDTTFTKTGLSSSTTYFFRVRAKDTAGNVSDWSEELEAATRSSSSSSGSSSSGSTSSGEESTASDVSAAISDQLESAGEGETVTVEAGSEGETPAVDSETLQKLAERECSLGVKFTAAQAELVFAPEALLIDELAEAGEDALVEIAAAIVEGEEAKEAADFAAAAGGKHLRAFDFSVTVREKAGAEEGRVVHNLNGTVTVTLDLSDLDLTGIDTNRLAVFHRLPDGTWVEEESTFDPASKTLTFTTGSFSLFAVMEKARVITLTVGQVEAAVDGRPYTLEAAPFIKAEAARTLVPVRFVSEALGAWVNWNARTRQVEIKDGGRQITLTIGSKDVLVDGAKSTIDCAPEILPPGRTFVPLRFVSETLGAGVNYDPAAKEITIIR